MIDLVAAEVAAGPLVYGSRGLGLVRGEGATVYDSDGRAYIDCGAMMGVAVTGHAHPRVVDAVTEQARLMLSCFSSFANDRRCELYAALSLRLPFARRHFLCNSGTEAVEAAVKFACAATGRTGLVCVEGSFHGRTLAALAMASRPAHRAPVEAILPPVRRVRFDDVADLSEAVDDMTAAIVIETIQGEGGVRALSEEFITSCEALARERGAMLVVDEVQTGLGRTGRLFAHERAGITPDVLCLAKGLASGVPIGCASIGERLGDPAVGAHGSTFGGNPLAAAAACATLAVIDDERLVERARVLGEVARERLQPLVGSKVRSVRGRGAMIGVDLPRRSAPLLRSLQGRGVIALAAGPTVLRLLPPLVIGDEDWAAALDAIVEELDR